MISRRGFLRGAGAAACVVALGGGAAWARQDCELLRPPGGQDEDAFFSACIRCDRCRSICPQRCIETAVVEDGLTQVRTPKLNFHAGHCDFCAGANAGAPLCREVCPTGALRAFDPLVHRIGVAVVDTQRCIAWGSGSCNACFDSCDFGALVIDASQRPTVNAQACNGCGACVEACNVNVYTAYSGTDTRAIEVQRLKGDR